MDDFEILNLMIQEKAQVKLDESSSSKPKVVLAEANLYSATILGMPDRDNVIIIKGDALAEPTQLFNRKNGVCRRADFMIIARLDERRKYVVFIEMKACAKTSKEWGIIQQLQGTQCLFAYCKEVGRVFWKEPNFLNTYQPRFVSIRHIGSNEQPIIEGRIPLNNRPDSMLKLNSNLIYFKRLVGK
jgi:hypothetical protein